MRALSCLLLVACGAPSAGESALVMLSEPARLAGAAVNVDGVVHAPVLPMSVPVGEEFVIETADGSLDVALDAGDVLLVDGAEVRLEWLVLGVDVRDDSLAMRVDGMAPWEAADLFDAQDAGGDGDFLVLEGLDLLWSAADRDVPEVVEALPVGPDQRRIGGAARDFGRVKTFDFDGIDVAGAIVAPAGVGPAAVLDPDVVYGVDAPWPLEFGDYAVIEHGIQIVDLEEGTGDVVEPHDRITVDYVGWRADGFQIDSSYKYGHPTSFHLDGLILGWAKGLPGMRVGGLRQLVIPPEAAYGDRDMPTIPPGSTLVFAVRMLDVEHPARR